jgi:hypothetical protein
MLPHGVGWISDQDQMGAQALAWPGASGLSGSPDLTPRRSGRRTGQHNLGVRPAHSLGAALARARAWSGARWVVQVGHPEAQPGADQVLGQRSTDG